MLRLNGASPELAGPCGPDPWYIEVGADQDPVEVVGRLSRTLMGEPLLVHSTSWRRARGSVILSFVVVNRDDQAPELPGIPIGRASWPAPEPPTRPSRSRTSWCWSTACGTWPGWSRTMRPSGRC